MCGQRLRGLALRVGGEDAPPHEHVFAHREPQRALLLLVAEIGEVGVEQVVGGVALTGSAEADHVDQHFREGVAGIGPVRAALGLEVEEQAAVAD